MIFKKKYLVLTQMDRSKYLVFCLCFDFAGTRTHFFTFWKAHWEQVRVKIISITGMLFWFDKLIIFYFDFFFIADDHQESSLCPTHCSYLLKFYLYISHVIVSNVRISSCSADSGYVIGVIGTIVIGLLCVSQNSLCSLCCALKNSSFSFFSWCVWRRRREFQFDFFFLISHSLIPARPIHSPDCSRSPKSNSTELTYFGPHLSSKSIPINQSLLLLRSNLNWYISQSMAIWAICRSLVNLVNLIKLYFRHTVYIYWCEPNMNSASVAKCRGKRDGSTNQIFLDKFLSRAVRPIWLPS